MTHSSHTVRKGLRYPLPRNWLRHAAAVVRLGRPKFLLGGFALFALGSLLAWVMGYGFDLAVYVWGQIAVTATQLMTHYSNDYFDVDADRANSTPTRWSGGSRVLVRGELPRWSALLAALTMAVIACVATARVVQLPGVPKGLVLLIFGAMLVLSWSYSSPPLRLHSHGLGEPTVAIVVPLLTPLVGFVLQAGAIRALLLVLVLPLILLQLVMLLTLQIPDAQGDRKVDKKTWSVIFGVRRVVLLCSLLVPLSFVLGLVGSSLGVPAPVAWSWLCLIPLGVCQELYYVRRYYRQPAKFNRLAFGSVALFFLAIVGDIIGLVAASLLVDPP